MLLLQAFSSLPDGGYTLLVQAQDGAGNTNGTPLTRSWTVTAPRGSYAQITVPPPTVSHKSLDELTSMCSPYLLSCDVKGQSKLNFFK